MFIGQNIGLFFIEADRTILLIVAPGDLQYDDALNVFETNRKGRKRYDSVVSGLTSESVEVRPESLPAPS